MPPKVLRECTRREAAPLLTQLLTSDPKMNSVQQLNQPNPQTVPSNIFTLEC